MNTAIHEKDCAGQAHLVRSLKRELDAAIDEADSPESIDRAKDVAFLLAVELEAFGIICRRCLGRKS